MNKIINPFVKLVLRSPFRRWMSTLLLLTYVGRKSGKEFSLPVQYVQVGQTVYIIPEAAEQKTWWRNLRGGAPVRLLLAGQTVNGNADVLEGARVDVQIVEAYLRRFPPYARMRNLSPGPDGSYDLEAVRRAMAGSVMVTVELAQ